MRKPSNGNKVCAFANCKSDGRTLPKDTAITFIPFAKPCALYKKEAIDILLGKNTGQERHKPADCAQCSRALQWIHLCRRADNNLKNLLDITNAFFICSKHFIDNKPTEMNPDPLPANISVEQEMKKRRVKRKSPQERVLVPSSKKPTKTSTVKDGFSVPNKENDVSHCNMTNKTSQNPPPPDMSAEEINKTYVILAVPQESWIVLPSEPRKTSATVNDGLAVPNEELDVSNEEMPARSASTYTQEKTAIQPTQPCNTEENNMPATATNSQSHGEVSCQTQLNINMESFVKQKMLSGWGTILNGTQAIFLKYDVSTCASLIDVRVLYTSPILQCETLICGHKIGEGCELHKEQMTVQSYVQLDKYLRLLETTSLCKGISDKSSIEEYFKTPKSGEYCHITRTVRSLKCKLLSRGRKCMECLKYENCLKTRIRYSMKKKSVNDNKNCNNRFLDKNELLSKVKQYRKQIKSLNLTVQRLRRKYDRVIQSRQVELEDNNDMTQLLKKAKETFEDGSELGIFLKEQLKVAQRKSCKGHKWNSDILRWCLYIYKLSPVTYAALRAAAYLFLPSERKLRGFSSSFKSAPGFPDSLPTNNADEIQNLIGGCYWPCGLEEHAD